MKQHKVQFLKKVLISPLLYYRPPTIMTSSAGQTVQQLRQEIQDELITANQLAQLISNELQQIKMLTNPGGPFESNIIHNASLISTLASTCHINIENAPPLVRKTIDLKTSASHNNLQSDHNMDDSQ